MEDPAVALHAIPILAWARVLWLRRLPPSELDIILTWATEKMENKAEPWRYVDGPAQAYLLTLARLAWIPKGGNAILPIVVQWT